MPSFILIRSDVLPVSNFVTDDRHSHDNGSICRSTHNIT